jgi:hypothetical protein
MLETDQLVAIFFGVICGIVLGELMIELSKRKDKQGVVTPLAFPDWVSPILLPSGRGGVRRRSFAGWSGVSS